MVFTFLKLFTQINHLQVFNSIWVSKIEFSLYLGVGIVVLVAEYKIWDFATSTSKKWMPKLRQSASKILAIPILEFQKRMAKFQQYRYQNFEKICRNSDMGKSKRFGLDSSQPASIMAHTTNFLDFAICTGLLFYLLIYKLDVESI